MPPIVAHWRVDYLPRNDGSPKGTHPMLQAARFRCLTRLALLSTCLAPMWIEHAAGQALPVRRYTEADGLSSTFVMSLLQDRQGFLWIGTDNGLNRFDGYEFRLFRHIPADSTSIGNDTVESLFEDSEGFVWAGGWEGTLSRYDPRTESFAVYRHDANDPTSLGSGHVTTIYEDRAGWLWVGSASGGLCRFNRQNGTCTRFEHDPADPTTLSSNNVRTVIEDRLGRLWVGTGFDLPDPRQGGLNRMDPASGTFTRYLHNPNDRNSLVDSRVEVLFEDRDGRLWAGTCSDGLHRYEPDSDQFTRFGRGAGATAGPAAPVGANPTCVTVIGEEEDGRAIWVGGQYKGIDRFDRISGEVTRYRYDANDERTIGASTIWAFLEDRQGSIWLGGALGRITPSAQKFGVIRYDPAGTGLSHPNVTAVMEDSDGDVWIGTPAGLTRQFRDSGRSVIYRHDPSDPNSLDDSYITCLYADSHGALWVGTTSGLNRFGRATGRFLRYGPARAGLQGDHVVRANTLLEDRKGVLWIGTEDGLYRLDRRNGAFVHYPNRTAEGLDPSLDVSRNRVVALYEDRSDRFWVGTWGGLFRFDPQTGDYALVLDTGMSSDVSGITEDAAGNLWIGFPSRHVAGLYQFEPETRQFVRYTAQDGLPSSSVRALLADDEGNLWISTRNGLSRFEPQGASFRNYFAADGLQSNVFYRNSAFKGAGGELFFGGSHGLTRFFPAEVTDNQIPPQLVLTDLLVFGESVSRGHDRLTNLAVSALTTLTLSHDRNDLTFAYVGLHFSDPSRNRYRYRLEPYERDWVDAGTARSARYTNLGPGAYVFRVSAANSDGVWNEEGAVLRVTILPPWWRTTWAYVLYGLVIVGGILAVLQAQKRHIQHRERERARERELVQAQEIQRAYHDLEKAHTILKETQRQLIQAEKMASLGRMASGIAHEMRNPLNFVNNFAELNAELLEELGEAARAGQDVGPLLTDLRDNMSQIVRHGKRADGILGSLMQHTFGAQGTRRATPLNRLVSDSVDIAIESRRNRVEGLPVHLERTFDESISDVFVLPAEMGRAFVNLLTNALDAVFERADSAGEAYKPEVSVSTRRVGEWVEIRFTDNGPGIPTTIRDRIFEPFFTTKPTGTATGLGLPLAYEIIVDGHAGTLVFESKEGEGASFVVILPISEVTQEES